MRQIQLIESKSEICAGTRGASLGPDAMKIASINAQSSFFNHRNIIEIPNENQLLFSPTTKNKAINIEGLTTIFKHFTIELGNVIDRGLFPVVLAGDHSTAAATIAGLKAKHRDKRLGVIWIDAHADLHSPYTTPTGNMHGMPLAISLGEDNIGNKKNEAIEESLIQEWENLKNWKDINPKILYSDIVFVAVRDTEREEDFLMEKFKMKNFTVQDIQSQGASSIARQTVNLLENCDIIYISFDVDSMDCDIVSHGTGTPVENGLTPVEANTLLNELLKYEKVCCLEISEVNPTLDEKCNAMAETAFKILESCAQTIEEN